MLQSFNARTGLPSGAPLPETSAPDIDAAVRRAHAAFADWQSSDGAMRARLLQALAQALEADRAQLVELADAETGLGPARLSGELD
ncbi:MAG: aldehyde dehydrogenase family protein, partial [Curvibacter sp.]